MLLASHQPNHLPNLGYFYKMAKCDTFVIFTQTQFEKREGWQRRHKIKTPEGDAWLTVPVTGSSRAMIKDIGIEQNPRWKKKIENQLINSYQKTPHKEILKDVLAIYNKPHTRLAELNLDLIKYFKELLEIPSRLVMDEEVGGIKHELMINTCKKYSADTYLSGLGAKDYMTEERLKEMKENGIGHKFVDKNITGEYPYTILHYLLTDGPESVKSIILS